MRTLIVQFFKIPIQLSTRLISADATSCTWSHRLPPLSSDFPILRVLDHPTFGLTG